MRRSDRKNLQFMRFLCSQIIKLLQLFENFSLDLLAYEPVLEFSSWVFIRLLEVVKF